MVIANRLLNEDLNETVTITTLARHTVINEEGHVATVPAVFTGVLGDFDEKYILLTLEDGTTVKVRHEFVAIIERVSEAAKVMQDPEKPKKGDTH